jgi:hypothetical protein
MDENELKTSLKELLVSFQLRGLLTCFGVRKTSGSMNRLLPTKEDISSTFNRCYTVYSETLT